MGLFVAVLATLAVVQVKTTDCLIKYRLSELMANVFPLFIFIIFLLFILGGYTAGYLTVTGGQQLQIIVGGGGQVGGGWGANSPGGYGGGGAGLANGCNEVNGGGGGRSSIMFGSWYDVITAGMCTRSILVPFFFILYVLFITCICIVISYSGGGGGGGGLCWYYNTAEGGGGGGTSGGNSRGAGTYGGVGATPYGPGSARSYCTNGVGLAGAQYQGGSVGRCNGQTWCIIGS